MRFSSGPRSPDGAGSYRKAPVGGDSFFDLIFHRVAKVITVDDTLSFAQMALDEDLSMLKLITAGLVMSLMLLVLAAVEAARRACLAVRGDFAVDRVARFLEGSESHPSPWDLKPPGEEQRSLRP
jgi:hypothetical protein